MKKKMVVLASLLDIALRIGAPGEEFPCAWGAIPASLDFFPGSKPLTDKPAPESGTSRKTFLSSQTAPRYRVELFSAFGEKPVLLITYPWKQYNQASIELRLFSRSEPDNEHIQPLFFRSRYWKGPLLQTGYDCLLQGAQMPISKSFSTDKLEGYLIADRSILGRAALTVVCPFASAPPVGSESGVAVVYPLLEQWAQDDCHLCLELPGSYYHQAGQIRVWFLRDHRIVWTHKLGWPGLRESNARKSPPTEAPKANKQPTPPKRKSGA